MGLSLGAALFAGLLSFLSPCVLPLVPTYLLYLGGERGRPLFNAVFFVLGFSMVFVLLGLPFTLLGSLLLEYRQTLGKVGGIAMMLFGLYLIGLRPAFLVRRLSLQYRGDPSRPWGAFMLGGAIGVSWTPCIGPILGGILTLTASGAGFPFLLAYVAGLAIPFLLVALLADKAKVVLKRVGRYARGLELAAGGVMVAIGFLMVTGQFTVMNGFFLRLTPDWLLQWL